MHPTRVGFVETDPLQSAARHRRRRDCPSAGCPWGRAVLLAVAFACATPGIVAAVSSRSATCSGDCDGNGVVQVPELVKLVTIALDTESVSACAAGDSNLDGTITINEILRAVSAALDGCPSVFEFLAGESTAAKAMAAMYQSGTVVPETQAEADAWLEGRTKSAAVIQANLPEVRSSLLGALQSLSLEKTNGFIALAALVKQAGGSSEILTHLHGLAIAPLTPAEQTVGEEPAAEELSRGVIMDLIYHHARAGNVDAKALLLTAARSPSFVVQKSAVQGSLHLSRSRRLTQRALAAELPRDRRFLLYQF